MSLRSFIHEALIKAKHAYEALSHHEDHETAKYQLEDLIVYLDNLDPDEHIKLIIAEIYHERPNFDGYLPEEAWEAALNKLYERLS